MVHWNLMTFSEYLWDIFWAIYCCPLFTCCLETWWLLGNIYETYFELYLVAHCSHWCIEIWWLLGNIYLWDISWAIYCCPLLSCCLETWWLLGNICEICFELYLVAHCSHGALKLDNFWTISMRHILSYLLLPIVHMLPWNMMTFRQHLCDMFWAISCCPLFTWCIETSWLLDNIYEKYFELFIVAHCSHAALKLDDF